ncbi:calmodulin-binding transcription activator 4 isoform X2 [Raphanus sativus]|uniref:Calmodulin-binding transcription activator 4 isoform X2 n=1 Tax=Raphanus sativus TaxID=3726 RepID=A0A6J0KEI3_RAPSA|nr:calmodulin-binding transcription activator 4 isoform X2 [Raphanus sativus]
MQSEYEISTLSQEAKTRWLKPPEVYFILKNHERYELTHKAPHKPTSGSLYLFNKRVLKFFRKDGHQWRKKRDGRAIAEAHERLKVGNVEALNCYYAHGEHDPSFQRRIFWMLDLEYDHIVLVHYRDVSDGNEGRQSSGTVLQFSLNPTTLFSSPSYNHHHHIGESSTDIQQQQQSSTSLGIAEANSGVVFNSSNSGGEEGSGSSYEIENREAFRRLEEQLSLDDDILVNATDPVESLDGLDLLDFSTDTDHRVPPATVHQRPESSSKLRRCCAGYVGPQYDNVVPPPPLYSQNESLDSLLSLEYVKDMSHLAQPAAGHQRPESNRLDRSNGGYFGVEYHHPNSLMLVNNDSGGSGGSGDQKSGSWKDVLEAFGASTALNSEGSTLSPRTGLLPGVQGDSNWTYSNQIDQATLLLPQELGSSLQLPACYSEMGAPENNGEYSRMMNEEGQTEQEMNHTVAYKQKFTIEDISPEWGYATETTKVIIIGSFLCDPTESTWACMFGNDQVPFEIIKEGVIRCQTPPCGPGKVNLCITCGDGLSCSQIKEFEYRDKPDDKSIPRSSPGELSLLVEFVQTLLSDRKTNLEPSTDDEWSRLIRDGTATSSGTVVDWLLQELLKDKLDSWLSSRSQDKDQASCCSLSKQEQGIIHMVAGLGFDWALSPILGHGVNVDFRDSKGWSALHWAAQLGSEKMVSALIASGASPGAVTDPNTQDPIGKTPASIAASNGHKGLAGYLSEVALTDHLSSLTLEETEDSKNTAQAKAEKTVNSIAGRGHPVNNDPQSLAALKNAAQAAERIQAAFRAHSFRKRQQREAARHTFWKEYGIYADMSSPNARNYHSAALSIQKKYRGYKGRKEFLTKREKAVIIQAHVRGYQTRKQYKVICWAVGVLDKVILRWRRKGVGLKGFRQDVESGGEESEDEDILRVFRKQKVDGAVNEAFSRVLSMTRSQESRQQYHRVLTGYCKKKAELGKTETLGTGGSGGGYEDDDDDALFDIADMEYDNLFALP